MRKEFSYRSCLCRIIFQPQANFLLLVPPGRCMKVCVCTHEIVCVHLPLLYQKMSTNMVIEMISQLTVFILPTILICVSVLQANKNFKQNYSHRNICFRHYYFFPHIFFTFPAKSTFLPAVNSHCFICYLLYQFITGAEHNEEKDFICKFKSQFMQNSTFKITLKLN